MLPMSGSRHLSARNAGCKSSVSPRPEHRASRVNKVLAERNPAVVAVGAWVEGGHDSLENPSVSLAFNANGLRRHSRHIPSLL